MAFIHIWIPPYVFDMNLHPHEFRLYGHLSWRASTSNSDAQTVGDMASACRMSERSAHRALRGLEELGLIAGERRPGKPTIYTLLDPGSV